MPTTSPQLCRLDQAQGHDDGPRFDWTLRPGITAVTGDERSGKTTLLRLLSGDLPPRHGQRFGVDGAYLDLALMQDQQRTPDDVWARLSPAWPRWNAQLANALSEATGLDEHRHKALYMLSAGSRRKVGVIALLASGATITCLDQPTAGWDRPSIRVLHDFLRDMAERQDRAWVVADYEAEPSLPWRDTIAL